jgi:CheY-like chemotaxis protein
MKADGSSTKPNGAAILVVDDDADTCHNLSDILTDLGYRVETATDPLHALELARKTPYDIALLDLKMPGMDGLTLYREIKKCCAGTVAIVLTAYAGSTMPDEARSAGAWQILPKPVDFTKLLNLLGEALSQPLLLVVEDDRDLCANLWDLFRERGYRVCLAHDCPEAAARLKDQSFQVVLIDLKLPSGDGTEVFRLVRQNNPQARTVLITGHRTEMDHLIQRLFAEGADSICYKPFELPSLVKTLHQLTAARKT